MRGVRTVFLLVGLFLSACATPPIDLSGSDPSLTPDQAAADVASARNRRVAWGGVIVSVHNLKDETEMEVLGYPLDRAARPATSAPPQHRFLMVRPGYLESADYRNGRMVSATGAVTGLREGRVGDATYFYPVLQTDQLYLWSAYEGRRGPDVHFGIGVIFGR